MNRLAVGDHWRVLTALALAFFVFIGSVGSRSNDPNELMRTVGGVSGVVGGIRMAMFVFGLIGKKSWSPGALAAAL